MYRSREDVYSFRDILSFPQFSQKKKTKEKDLTRILVQQTKTGNVIGWTISWNHIVFCQPEPRIFAFSHWNTRKVYSHYNLYSENADLLHIFKKLFSLSFLSIYIFLPNKWRYKYLVCMHLKDVTLWNLNFLPYCHWRYGLAGESGL